MSDEHWSMSSLSLSFLLLGGIVAHDFAFC